MTSIMKYTIVVFATSISTAFADPLVDYAQTRFNESVAYVNESEEKCYADLNVLPDDVFEDVNITNDEIRITLQYFYTKSLTDCTAPSVKDFLVSASTLSALDSERSEDIKESTELVIHTNLSKLKAEFEYIQLPASLKDQLNSIDALRRPFDLMTSVRKHYQPEK